MSCNSLIAQVNLSDGISNNGFLNNSKPKVSVSLSTSFSTFGYGYSAIGTSIMPQITFPVTNKLSLRTGIGYSTFFMAGNGESMFNSSPSNYGHVFVSGDYLLNEKITLRGTAYKTFNLNSKTPEIEPVGSIYDFSSQGVIMDVEYKVTDNFRINVGFEYRQQNYPMYNPNGYPMMSGMGNNSLFMNHNNRQGLNPF